MNERTKQFRVGVVAAATLVITAILITWHSDFSTLPFAERYQIRVLVDQAPGVAPNTPVRRRGILVGRVDSVEATDDGAMITLSIDEGKEIKTNEAARIQTSLIGDAVLEFVPVESPEGATPLEPGDLARGMYNPNPVDLLAEMQGDLRQTVLSLGNAGSEVAELADRLNQVLGGQDLQRINRLVDNADKAMEGMARTMEDIEDLIGDEQFRQDIKEGMAQLPTTVGDAQAVLAVLERTLASADENLRNLQGLTGPLGERGDSIVATLESAIRNLEELFSEVALLSKSVNDSEGTLGLLIRDRQLYDRVDDAILEATKAIEDVRKITGDVAIRARIRQIVDNVNIIVQKIARDPARVLRGVVSRETPIGRKN
ncbi:MAG: MlaD family protein, partial [Planctomycetota bacterium]